MKTGQKLAGYKYDKGIQSKPKHKSVNVFNNPKPYSTGGTPMRSYPAKPQSLGSKIANGLKYEVGGFLHNIKVAATGKGTSTGLTQMDSYGNVLHKSIKTTGSFRGKSNKLGHGGRAAQLKAKGVPGGVIGNLARAAHAAPGQKNYHGKKHKKLAKKMCKKHKRLHCSKC